MEKVNLNGITLAYEVSGEGPPLLFIHGLGSCALEHRSAFNAGSKSRPCDLGWPGRRQALRIKSCFVKRSDFRCRRVSWSVRFQEQCEPGPLSCVSISGPFKRPCSGYLERIARLQARAACRKTRAARNAGTGIVDEDMDIEVGPGRVSAGPDFTIRIQANPVVGQRQDIDAEKSGQEASMRSSARRCPIA